MHSVASTCAEAALVLLRLWGGHRMRTRLLHIIWEGIGGTQRGVLDLTRKLDLKKYDITVAILRQSESVTDLINRKQVRVYEFGCRNGFDIRCMCSVYKFLFSNQFDIIVNHERSYLLNLALLKVRSRTVLIYHEHGMIVIGYPVTRLNYILFSRFYDVLIAINEDAAQRMIRANRMVLKKVIIIKNPVDTEAFAPSRGRSCSFSSRGRSQIIGTVARLVPMKDFDLFLETLKRLAIRLPNVRFVIVGDGQLRDQIKAAASCSHLYGRLSLTGQTSNVPEFLRSFDLFLFTSRIETFGRTIIESLACEVPVLAALPEIGGARDLLKELPGVYLVRERNPNVLAKAAITLLENPGLMQEMGQAGRKYVIANYSLNGWVEEMDSLYTCLLKKRLKRSIQNDKMIDRISL